MKPTTARLIRNVGLLIEVACLFGLLSLRRQNALVGKILGLERSVWLTAGIAIGFCLWAYGTVSLYWPRRKPEDKSSNDLHL